MATTSQVPRFVLMANVLTTTLLRAGVKLRGLGHPTYLLSVRGRKSGQLRTNPISVIEQGGRRYLMAPYGEVDWVRNLRAAKEATLTRGRRVEQVGAEELAPNEGSRVLKLFVETGNPIGRYFGVTPQSSQEEFVQAATLHPVFSLESKTSAKRP